MFLVAFWTCIGGLKVESSVVGTRALGEERSDGGWCVDMRVCRYVGRGTCGLKTRGPVVVSWLGGWPDLANPNYLLF